jgi:NAD(P)-dependent dehydrogenase (short-subunit alcohol dehydrogenase family)
MSKNCIIFGANGGIGEALAEKLSANGYKLLLCSRNELGVKELSLKIGAHSSTLKAINSEQIGNVFKEAKEQLGNIHCVVNAIGSLLLKPAHLTSDRDWDEVIHVNLNSSFYILRESVKAFGNNGGSIVLFSTAATQIGLPNHEGISAAKAGVEGLVRAAAATYASRNIRINAVAPGLTETPLTQKITSNPNALKHSVNMHPLGRVGTAKEIAHTASFLLDDDTSWITGQVITVDGGLSGLKK